MNDSDIIKMSLKNYDNSNDIMKRILKLYSVQIIQGMNNTQSKVIFIDKTTKKTVFEGEIETVGHYYDKFKIWCWSWSNYTKTQSEYDMARLVMIKAISFPQESSHLRAMLTTSRYIIQYTIQIDIILALFSEFSKHNYIFPIIFKLSDNTNYVSYYVISDNDLISNFGKTIEIEKSF